MTKSVQTSLMVMRYGVAVRQREGNTVAWMQYQQHWHQREMSCTRLLPATAIRVYLRETTR